MAKTLKVAVKKNQLRKVRVKAISAGSRAVHKVVRPAKAKDKAVGVAYARTSSFGKKLQGSCSRQVEQAGEVADSLGMTVHSVIAESISGSLKFDQRKTMKQVLEQRLPSLPADKKKNINLFVESVRALARSAAAAEQMYLTSKDNNVHIIPRDFPSLFTHTASPTESFVRKIICSLQELDRDVLVWRLAQGREHKKKTTRKRTQTGRPKVCGCPSYLEEWKITDNIKKQVEALAKRREGGGWRPLASKVSQLLKLDQTISHETVRRMLHEIKAKRKHL